MNEMKRKRFLISAVFMAFFILSPLGMISAEEAGPKESSKTFKFPSSIEVIEDQAFEGTAVKIVVFPDGLQRIGAKAFENAFSLTDVYIPDTTEYIADSAFSITPGLTIHGVDGSYAKDWAHRHEVPFVADDIWNVAVLKGNLHDTQTNTISPFHSIIALILLFSLFRNGCCELRSRRPQDRPELNPVDYRFP